MSSTLRPRARVAVRAPGSGDSFIRRNALGLACFGIFVVLVVALILTGHRTFNADQLDHGESTVSLGRYLTQGHFWEAIFENWESEFLQMAAYIVLTVFLIQKGSSESKDPEKHEAVASADIEKILGRAAIRCGERMLLQLGQCNGRAGLLVVERGQMDGAGGMQPVGIGFVFVHA